MIVEKEKILPLNEKWKSPSGHCVTLYRGDSDSPIKTPKCSLLRTNMQCGFIKVIRIERGSSNCKMIVGS